MLVKILMFLVLLIFCVSIYLRSCFFFHTDMNDDESKCRFVGSRGILKTCDIHSSTPVSSILRLIGYDFSPLRPGSILYICGTAIPEFVQNIHPHLPFPYILVSGDCDSSIPNDVFPSRREFASFLDSPTLIHWFSQNCVDLSHPKLSPIPIGMDYHTMAEKDHEWGSKTRPLMQDRMIRSLSLIAPPFWERKCRIYSNCHFSTRTRFGYDRQDAITNIPKDLVDYEPSKIPRKVTWMRQTEYAFVLSPHGNGLDCHRTWEALVLGCIPIVRTSPIDVLYTGLPVLIVREWSDVCMELLEATIREFRQKTFQTERLTLEYWIREIREPLRSLAGDPGTGPS